MKRISRRNFLQTGVGAAGGILASRAIPLDAEAVYAIPRDVPASDQLHFGIIGVGMQGSGLLSSAITLPGAQCVAACDLYDGRHTLAKEIAGPSIATTRRYQELLDNKTIDCLIVAVPDHWHRRIVVDALSAGKDVYCEKPMSHNVGDGAAMVASAEKSSRIVQVGSQRVSSLLFGKAKELYDYFFSKVQEGYHAERVKDGVFQAMMEVGLINDGPVSFGSLQMLYPYSYTTHRSLWRFQQDSPYNQPIRLLMTLNRIDVMLTPAQSLRNGIPLSFL